MASDSHVLFQRIQEKENSERPPYSISIYDWLEGFRAEELLTEDNTCYCSWCKKHQDSYKKMDIYKLPNILIIQLKRFNKEENIVSGVGKYISSSKNQDFVDFPIRGLDMGKYLLDWDNENGYVYDLYAVSNHIGSLYGGHYTAFCKNILTTGYFILYLIFDFVII